MCKAKSEAKTKLDELIEVMERLAFALRSLDERIGVATLPVADAKTLPG